MTIKTVSISVVVPFYNAEETLSLCIDGLLSQTIQPHEIILVDNNSNDSSTEIAKKIVEEFPEQFKYVLELKKGPGSARNSGVRQTTGEIICFTDADCVPEPNWLNDIVKPFNNRKIGAVAGQVVGFNTETLFNKFHYLFTLRGLQQSELFTEFTLIRGGFPTANLAVRKDVFEKINGFDETLITFGEDYDLCARIYQAGFYIQYITGAKARHKHRNTLKTTWNQGFGFGYGHSALLKKHFERMLIIDFPRHTYITKKWPVRMWLDLAGADKKIIFLVLITIVSWPFCILFFLYLFLLIKDMDYRLQQNNLDVFFWEKCKLVLLLIYKSMAMTKGRIAGSLVYKVFCV